MKSLRLILALAIAGFVAAAAQADEKESKPAKCCAKAAEKGEACTHECCMAAAKEGNNCVKCKGSGKIEKKEEHKK